MKTVLALAMAAAAAAPAVAAESGPYIRADLGGTFFLQSLKSSSGRTAITPDDTPSGAVALGYRFGRHVRFELQGSYASPGTNDISTRRVNGQLEPLSNVAGHAPDFSAMGNAIYAFSAPGRVEPYLGAGAGYGWFDTTGLRGNGLATFEVATPNPATRFFSGGTLPPLFLPVLARDAVRFDGGHGSFAYQALAGVSFPLSHRLKFDVNYRYLATTPSSVTITRVALNLVGSDGVVPSTVARERFALQQHVVAVGLRYDFGR